MTTRQHHQPATLTTLATAAILILATSCITSTTIEEIEKPFTTKESDPAYTNMGYISITLQNNAKGTLLLLDSIELCNISVITGNGNIKKGNAKIQENSLLVLPEQTFSPWNPAVLPSGSLNSYIKIHGKLYTYLADGKTMLLCSGPMYTPLQGHINPGKSTNTTIEMYDNCPIYFENNGVMTKALQAIGFDVSIVDWE